MIRIYRLKRLCFGDVQRMVSAKKIYIVDKSVILVDLYNGIYENL